MHYYHRCPHTVFHIRPDPLNAPKISYCKITVSVHGAKSAAMARRTQYIVFKIHPAENIPINGVRIFFIPDLIRTGMSLIRIAFIPKYKIRHFSFVLFLQILNIILPHPRRGNTVTHKIDKNKLLICSV